MESGLNQIAPRNASLLVLLFCSVTVNLLGYQRASHRCHHAVQHTMGSPGAIRRGTGRALERVPLVASLFVIVEAMDSAAVFSSSEIFCFNPGTVPTQLI
jgi:hypothetical protein